MAKYLSEEWLDEHRRQVAGQPERPGASARIQYVVTGGPDGDIKYWWQLEDGRLLDSALGVLDDPDFTLTLSYDDSTRILQGETDPNTAFMQGRMKAVGDMGKFLHLLPITASPEYQALQAGLRPVTEF